MPDKFITIVLSGHNLGYSVLYTSGKETSGEIVKAEDIPAYVSALAANNSVHKVLVNGPTIFSQKFCEDILKEAKTKYRYNNLEIEVI